MKETYGKDSRPNTNKSGMKTIKMAVSVYLSMITLNVHQLSVPL